AGDFVFDFVGEGAVAFYECQVATALEEVQDFGGDGVFTAAVSFFPFTLLDDVIRIWEGQLVLSLIVFESHSAGMILMQMGHEYITYVLWFQTGFAQVFIDNGFTAFVDKT